MSISEDALGAIKQVLDVPQHIFIDSSQRVLEFASLATTLLLLLELSVCRSAAAPLPLATANVLHPGSHS